MFEWNTAIKKLTNNVELIVGDLYQCGDNDRTIMRLYAELDNDNCKLVIVSDEDDMYDIGEEIILKWYDLKKADKEGE